MRASTCVVCRRQCGTEIAAYTVAADPIAHHHHVVFCAVCGAAWFEDLTRSAFGVVLARRDTLPCTCPPARWRRAVMFSPVPERACRCGARCLTGAEAAA